MKLESVNYFSEIETEAAFGNLPIEHNNSGFEPKSDSVLWLRMCIFKTFFFRNSHFQKKTKTKQIGNYISDALRQPNAYASLNLRYKLLNQLVVSVNFALDLVYRLLNNPIYSRSCPVSPLNIKDPIFESSKTITSLKT